MPALVILAILAGLLGLALASQATLGVALIGAGCLLAILARIAQANEHHFLLHPRPPSPVAQQIREAELANPPRRATPTPTWMKVVFVSICVVAVVVYLAIVTLPNSFWIWANRLK